MPVALITGGASYIARSAAQCLMEEGWQIVLADIDKEGLDKVASELGGAIDGLVNCASGEGQETPRVLEQIDAPQGLITAQAIRPVS